MNGYILRFPFFLLAFLATYPLAPIMALCSSWRTGWVNNAEYSAVEPRLWWWLDWIWGTPDNSLLGDDGHKARWAGKPQYFQRVAWLWRNKVYGLTWGLFGVEPQGRMVIDGNPWIKNRTDAVAGEVFIECENAWCYRSVTQTGPETCRMLEFGWRLTPWAQGRGGSGRAQYVCSIRLSTAFYPKEG